MKYARATILLILTWGLTACQTPLINIPLEWRPTSSADFSREAGNNAASMKIQFEPFTDARPRTELIAENHEEATPKEVTTRDNVAEFVRLHVRQAFDQAGLTTVDHDGDVVLAGDIRQLFVAEKGTYKATFSLGVKLTDRSGATLWKGVVSGESKRYGRMYAAGNYYKVISDSIVSAISALFNDADFRKALVQK
jgi:hypothetical protein